MSEKNYLTGKNALLEALRGDLGIQRVLFQKDMERKRIEEILTLLREKGIPFDWADKARLSGVDAQHQGIIAYLSAFPYAEFEDWLEEEGLIVLLDGITDPHNLGAIIRSAYSFGAKGLLLPKRRSAGLDAAALRASAGAAAHLPIARTANLSLAIRKLKEHGFWVYGAHAHTSSEGEVRYEKKSVLIIGSEDKGLSQEVQKHCDFFVQIPTVQFESLNASVAAGILFYTYSRQFK